jgi:type IV pilus assembly protein PilW
MNRAKNRLTPLASSARYQSGISLVELMVAMTIGLLITASAVALFANTMLSTRTLNSASKMQEAGNQIMGVLSRHVRMTGYIDWLSTGTIMEEMRDGDKYAAAYRLHPSATLNVFQSVFAADAKVAPATMPTSLSGCDSGYAVASVKDLTKTDCAASGTNSALTVAYQVAATSTAGSSASVRQTGGFSSITGGSGDCNNNAPRVWPALTGTSRGPFAVNRFFLTVANPSTALTGEPVLYDFSCMGNGNDKSQPFASNIEQFVVRYGLAPAPGAADLEDSNDTRVSSYQTAADITAANAWGRVIAIRMCVLLAGERGSATQSTAAATNRPDCNGTAIDLRPGNRLRQTFTSTISLRNHVHSATQ